MGVCRRYGDTIGELHQLGERTASVETGRPYADLERACPISLSVSLTIATDLATATDETPGPPALLPTQTENASHRTAPPATPTPTILPTIVVVAHVDSIEPQTLSVTELPAQPIVHGANLGQVRIVRLLADERQPIEMAGTWLAFGQAPINLRLASSAGSNAD